MGTKISYNLDVSLFYFKSLNTKKKKQKHTVLQITFFVTFFLYSNLFSSYPSVSLICITDCSSHRGTWLNHHLFTWSLVMAAHASAGFSAGLHFGAAACCNDAKLVSAAGPSWGNCLRDYFISNPSLYRWGNWGLLLTVYESMKKIWMEEKFWVWISFIGIKQIIFPVALELNTLSYHK